jgi:hypothetical protein
MKLQKNLAYKYKDKKHYKHVIIVPDDTVRKLGWDPGVELKQQTTGNTLILKPSISGIGKVGKTREHK